jgi:hypothetical protein
MVFGFVRQSRGHIEIESEVGAGTTIRLYLPRGRARRQSDGIVAEERRNGSLQGAHILVVEDNVDVREAVVARLGDLGCHVVEAENGPAALRIVEGEAEIDLMFTDIVMPGGMSGIDLAEAARRHRPALRVLFTSGFYEASGDADRRIGRLGGLLRKPYTADDMLQMLQAAVADGPRLVRAA